MESGGRFGCVKIRKVGIFSVLMHLRSMASVRLPVEDANCQSIFGCLTPDAFYAKHHVRHDEEYITNARGNLKLFTQRWEPIGKRSAGSEDEDCDRAVIKGVVIMLHGYGSDSSWMVQLTAIAIAQRGFLVHAVDHQGHGRSEGLKGHIANLSHLVDDCSQFVDRAISISPPNLPVFIYGESLGGALSLLLHIRRPHCPCAGIVLSGAMCEISPTFKPSWLRQQLLRLAQILVPLLEIVPTKDIPTVSFHEPWKRELAKANPRRNSSNPRVATAVALVKATVEVQRHMPDVQVPFLAVHGELDAVCDPKGVKQLYEKANSTDKTLQIYPNMWHQLIGEPREKAQTVFNDIFAWLEQRCY